jgi:hypothetical protein
VKSVATEPIMNTSEFTPKQLQAIRIAVAEAAGWHHIHYDGPELIVGHPRSQRKPDISPVPVPKYTESLDAVHEVENGLPIEKLVRYGHFLRDVLTWKWPRKRTSIFATALQRCIALLMTLAPDKWKAIKNDP